MLKVRRKYLIRKIIIKQETKIYMRGVIAKKNYTIVNVERQCIADQRAFYLLDLVC